MLNNKLPWLLASLPLLAALHSGCGSTTATSLDDGGPCGGDASCADWDGASDAPSEGSDAPTSGR